MKPTTTICVCLLAAGMAAAQSPISVIQNTRTTMNAVRDQSAAASNAALATQERPAPVASVAHISARSSFRKAGPKKPVGVVPPEKSAHAKPMAPPKSNPPVAPTVAAKSAPEGAESENPSGVEGAGPDKWNADGKRDPFVSPVVSRSTNPQGCSAGKKCLEIGTINLRGIVRSENGFIAVVSNGLNKAYFLRENDPVFNGYVMKITGDSIVFQETVQDRLGKEFKREVVKKITAPAV